MKRWIQRSPQTRLGPSPSDEFHGCLDALIVTIRDMRDWLAESADYYERKRAKALIECAEERAAICAGLLFDRWIEETETSSEPLCLSDDCRGRYGGKYRYPAGSAERLQAERVEREQARCACASCDPFRSFDCND